MKNILTLENIREAWSVAHNNMTGDVIRASRWIEINHDEIIGCLIEQITVLQKQLNANCLQRDALLIENRKLKG